MRLLRDIGLALLWTALVIVLFIPALFGLILEEVEHKKGDEDGYR